MSPQTLVLPLALRLALPFAVLLFVASCSGSSGGGSPTDPDPVLTATVEKVESDLLQALNRERSSRGQSILTLDPTLRAIAREHSEAMRDQGFFDHVDPSGEGFVDRLQKAGVQFRLAGENLAFAENFADPAAGIHGALMGNSEHRDNILKDGYDQVAVGAARRGNTYWVTQLFIASR